MVYLVAHEVTESSSVFARVKGMSLINILQRHNELLLVSPCGFSVVQSKLNTPPMTIVMLREERNHDLQHDLGHLEDQRISVILKSVAGVVLQVLDMRR